MTAPDRCPGCTAPLAPGGSCPECEPSSDRAYERAMAEFAATSRWEDPA